MEMEMNALSYNDCISTIEIKHKIKTRGYKHKDFKGVYFDFWHTLIDLYGNEISNPCELLVNLDDVIKKGNALTSKEIMNILAMQVKMEKRNPEFLPDLSEQIAEIAVRARHDWREHITSLIRDEFPEYIKEDCILFKIEW